MNLHDEGFHLMEDGSIMAFDRYLQNELTLIRYLPDGSLDQSFGTNGFADMPYRNCCDPSRSFTTLMAS